LVYNIMMMRLILIFISLFLWFGSGVKAKESVKVEAISPAPAIISDYTLPYPGLLPDHPLYSLKVLRDKILIWFTKDDVKLVELNLLMADKRLKMGEVLFEKGNKELALSTISKGEKYFGQAVYRLRTMKNTSKESVNVLQEKLARSSVKHKEVVMNLMKNDKDREKGWKKILDLVEEIQIELVRLK